MQSAMKLTTPVLPGRRVEFDAPELAEGTRVDPIVLLEEPPATQADTAVEPQGVWDWLQSLPRPAFGGKLGSNRTRLAERKGRVGEDSEAGVLVLQ